MSEWDEESNAEGFEPSAWVADVVRAMAFEERCGAAAAAALSVARLREERRRVGFVPLSLDEYIHGLVKLADVPIAPVLSLLGVEDLSGTESQSARAAARLARAIGMSVREALAHLRIGLAAQFGSAPVSLLVARHRSPGSGRPALEECEDVLRRIESEYDLEGLRTLRQLKAEVGATFE
jgi:hypothetical protein